MLRKLFVLALAAVLAPALTFYATSRRGVAQAGPPQTNQSQAEREMLERQAKEANKKRQLDIRTDTDKLLQLATELKAAVDKSDENMLSLDVVRKADEVEHLAHRVKEKMKESVGPPKREVIPNPRAQQ